MMQISGRKSYLVARLIFGWMDSVISRAYVIGQMKIDEWFEINAFIHRMWLLSAICGLDASLDYISSFGSSFGSIESDLWSWCIIGPYLFQNEERNAAPMNGEGYLAMIRNFLWAKLEQLDVEELWFLQDGATSHPANKTIALLAGEFSHGSIISRNIPFNWPARSCDLTSMDLLLWGYLKSFVYRNTPQNDWRLVNKNRPGNSSNSSRIYWERWLEIEFRDVCTRRRGGHLHDDLFRT